MLIYFDMIVLPMRLSWSFITGIKAYGAMIYY